MSRHVLNPTEHKEVIYGSDDFGYYYLIFDDNKGIPEDEFLIDKDERVEPEKFISILTNNGLNPEDPIVDLIKHNIEI